MRERCRCQGPPCDGDEVRPRRIRRFIEPAVLLLLHDRPTHGYGLLEGLAKLGLDAYPTDQSVVYRILRDLEQAGMIASEWETEETAGPPRRVYRLTDAGDEHLKAWVEELRATDRILHRFLDAYDHHMENGQGEFHESDEPPERRDTK
ncbi:MAG: helix-turn-helix transcriptional regulator [Anaerolineae bacterium]|nr:helix-turn-helix transcriptional regulator [Anaerolineae bacterium]